MSSQFGKVVSIILLERFGELGSKIGTLLLQSGTVPLIYLVKTSGLPPSKVKEALCVLIKYGLVKYVPNKTENAALYAIQTDNIILMLRYPRYINLIKKFGKAAEILLEEILQRGCAKTNDLLLRAAERLKENHELDQQLPVAKEQFISLVSARYIMRCPKIIATDVAVPVFQIDDAETFAVPKIDIRHLVQLQEGESVEQTEADVYWCVNFDRFHQDFRDNLLIQAVTQKFDENCGALMQILLTQMYIRTEPWADVSNPIPGVEIKEKVKKLQTHPLLVSYADQYLNILEEDSCNFIRKTGDASGGQYTILMKDAFTELTWELLENIVLEKFDTKAARIFRLVRAKRYIEAEKIQQLAMIPAKEAKGLSYKLLEEGFLQFQELKKAPSNTGPNKSFTLFQVVLDQVVRMVLEICYKSVYNAMVRRHHERVVNKRLIDKKQRVETIAMGMKVQGASEDQLNDIKEMITPPETEVLKKIGKMMKKLNTAELEIDETIFLLQLYLSYH